MQRCNVTTCRAVNFYLTGLNTVSPPVNSYTPKLTKSDSEYCWVEYCKKGE